MSFYVRILAMVVAIHGALWQPLALAEQAPPSAAPSSLEKAVEVLPAVRQSILSCGHEKRAAVLGLGLASEAALLGGMLGYTYVNRQVFSKARTDLVRGAQMAAERFNSLNIKNTASRGVAEQLFIAKRLVPGAADALAEVMGTNYLNQYPVKGYLTNNKPFIDVQYTLRAADQVIANQKRKAMIPRQILAATIVTTGLLIAATTYAALMAPEDATKARQWFSRLKQRLLGRSTVPGLHDRMRELLITDDAYAIDLLSQDPELAQWVVKLSTLPLAEACSGEPSLQP